MLLIVTLTRYFLLKGERIIRHVIITQLRSFVCLNKEFIIIVLL